jgi:hypothetical protein
MCPSDNLNVNALECDLGTAVGLATWPHVAGGRFLVNTDAGSSVFSFR